MKAKLVYENGDIVIKEVKVENKNKIMQACLSVDEIGCGVSYIDFLYDYFVADAGDDGYFVTNFKNDGTFITEFKVRDDDEYVCDTAFVACYGYNRGSDGIIGIVTGMRCDFGMILGVKDGKYYSYPRFYTDGDLPYEDIVVEYHFLKDGSYSQMAKEYRKYQLENGGCKTLRERVADEPALKKSCDGIEVRVRMAWKPVPSPVEYQTPETEPAVYPACNFRRIGDIVDKFKAEGIDNAEFCLVGWNIGGHDGRFPQIFPVEPSLGGESEMVALIEKTKNMGYNIVCHDDATAAYTIADCFDEEYLLKNKDGSLHKRPYCWGGGRPHKICPQRQYERFEISNQKKLKEFGFEGLHYIDVITILPLLNCYDKAHKLNRKQSAEYYDKIMKLSRENFGGFASESGYDFAASDLDYAMYISFKNTPEEFPPLCDRIIPFWEIVYHGIIMYNSSTFTLNYMAKNKRNRIKYMETGGRPLVCYYANFAKGHNWMGLEDFICDTDSQLEDSVQKIKQMAEDYDLLKPERYEFIENHSQLGDGVFCTEYSNGTKVIVDYNNETFEIKRK